MSVVWYVAGVVDWVAMMILMRSRRARCRGGGDDFALLIGRMRAYPPPPWDVIVDDMG